MLEKLKSTKINFTFLLLLAYLVKMLVLKPDYPDAIIMGFLCALYGYRLKIKILEPKDPDANIKKDVQEIKNALSKMNLAKLSDPKKYF